jgi:hypothetical protein
MSRSDRSHTPLDESTLRDYFAAAALQGLISGMGLVDGTDTTRIENTAYQAYQFADAMLKERAK